ncbi:hypothetical protein C8R44DRAFT_729683 [Mycena epipterygia]|nr:hypothetical protein C8R44DRAFT_729683 [Mycena epipterygia]
MNYAPNAGYSQRRRISSRSQNHGQSIEGNAEVCGKHWISGAILASFYTGLEMLQILASVASAGQGQGDSPGKKEKEPKVLITELEVGGEGCAHWGKVLGGGIWTWGEEMADRSHTQLKWCSNGSRIVGVPLTKAGHVNTSASPSNLKGTQSNMTKPATGKQKKAPKGKAAPHLPAQKKCKKGLNENNANVAPTKEASVSEKAKDKRKVVQMEAQSDSDSP